MKIINYIIVFSLILTINTGCREMKKPRNAFNVEEATIASIHQAYMNGALTCEELVSEYIKRIEKYDKPSGINSIVIINPDVLKEARLLDSLFRTTGKLLPLHGIPVIVKDNIDTRRLQTTAGSASLIGFEPANDATIISLLKEAGAIVLCKSNMAEWAFSPMVTISSTAGETHNPYNIAHVPAGSSGGTAAAVASSFGTVGLGTDTGNSIRGPSSHCSLVGFRTTIGLISRTGIAPLYLRNDVVGPMTRSVEDAVRMLDVMAAVDLSDPVTAHSDGMRPESYMDFLDKDGLTGSRIGVLRILSENKTHPEIKDLFEQALADISSLGGTVIDIDIPGFNELSQNHWASTFRWDLEKYLLEEEGAPVNSLQEIVDLGNYSPYIESRLLHHLDYTDDPEKRDPPVLDAYSDPGRIAFREAIESVMDKMDLDAIVYPSWNNPPARIGHFEEYLGDSNQIIAPHTGQPAFTIPMGFVSGNLPAGIQFLGRSFDEPLLIKLCYSFEQGTKRRRAPEL